MSISKDTKNLITSRLVKINNAIKFHTELIQELEKTINPKNERIKELTEVINSLKQERENIKEDLLKE